MYRSCKHKLPSLEKLRTRGGTLHVCLNIFVLWERFINRSYLLFILILCNNYCELDYHRVGNFHGETTPTQAAQYSCAVYECVRHCTVHLNICGSYFRCSKTICENHKSLHHAKFPAIRYVYNCCTCTHLIYYYLLTYSSGSGHMERHQDLK